MESRTEVSLLKKWRPFAESVFSKPNKKDNSSYIKTFSGKRCRKLILPTGSAERIRELVLIIFESTVADVVDARVECASRLLWIRL